MTRSSGTSGPSGVSGRAAWWGFSRPALSVTRAVLPHPRLWPSAVAVVLRLARPGWWRQWPPLPLPPAGYWRFRLVTAYGGDGRARLSSQDVVAYLLWCRRMRTPRD